VIWLLARDPAARAAGIIFTTKEGDHFLFSEKTVLGPIPIGSPALEDALINRDAWWLMDGREQGPISGSECKLILATSPRFENFKELDKSECCATFWMPVWDLDAELGDNKGNWQTSTQRISPELELLRREVYPNVTHEALVEAVNRWGPVPRYVLAKVFNAETQKSLDRAINVCDASLLARTNAVGGISNGISEEYYSHKLCQPNVDRRHFALLTFGMPRTMLTVGFLNGDRSQV
jgi:hypothetical protein